MGKKIKGFDSLKVFFFFFIPAAICLSVDVVFFYLRSKQLMKYLANEQEVVKQAEQKMAALRERYGKKN